MTNDFIFKIWEYVSKFWSIYELVKSSSYYIILIDKRQNGYYELTLIKFDDGYKMLPKISNFPFITSNSASPSI